MATIDSLHKSISCMSPQEVTALIIGIRTNRRRRPEITRKITTAREKKAPSKKNPKQQDLFQLILRMTPEEKAAMARSLLG